MIGRLTGNIVECPAGRGPARRRRRRLSAPHSAEHVLPARRGVRGPVVASRAHPRARGRASSSSASATRGGARRVRAPDRHLRNRPQDRAGGALRDRRRRARARGRRRRPGASSSGFPGSAERPRSASCSSFADRRPRPAATGRRRAPAGRRRSGGPRSRARRRRGLRAGPPRLLGADAAADAVDARPRGAAEGCPARGRSFAPRSARWSAEGLTAMDERPAGSARTRDRRRDALEQTLRPRSLRRVHRPGAGQGQPRRLPRGRASSGAEPLDHVLLYGPPGLGKTTLAHIIAREMGGQIRVTSGPVDREGGGPRRDRHEPRAGRRPVHRRDPPARDARSRRSSTRAWRTSRSTSSSGPGPGARTVRLELPRFTLVGATTRVGLLSPPLRDRFGIVHHLDYYTRRGPGDDRRAIGRDPRRSRSTRRAPRRSPGARGARRASSTGCCGACATSPRSPEPRRDRPRRCAAEALERLEVDRYGLDEVDRRILTTILEKFDGGPVGLSTLAAAVGEDGETLEEIYEPYLIQIGFLERTPRGRRATRRAPEHLGTRFARRTSRLAAHLADCGAGRGARPRSREPARPRAAGAPTPSGRPSLSDERPARPRRRRGSRGASASA